MFLSRYSTIIRRGYEITLPKSVIKYCNTNNYRIMLVKNTKNQPSSVQVVKAKYNYKTKTNTLEYIGTVKKMLNVKTFKDNNPCNFKKSNLIFE